MKTCQEITLRSDVGLTLRINYNPHTTQTHPSFIILLSIKRLCLRSHKTVHLLTNIPILFNTFLMFWLKTFILSDKQLSVHKSVFEVKFLLTAEAEELQRNHSVF